jgi:DeoR/GlpR family transcriptional regulator of sugar metabolism
MLADQRQDVILAAVRARGAVRVADLVERFGVSDMTVRRDIGELARAGLVRRVHGGAVADVSRASEEPEFEAKRTWAAAEKQAIARAALVLIGPHASIALSAGTTTHVLAALIAATPELRPLTVVTNSLPVADTLYRAGASRAGALDVVLTGGTRTRSDALVGPLAVAALATLRVDRLFLGVHGLDAAGLTTPNLLESETNRALIACAAETVVLADHGKWGLVGLSRIVPLDTVDTVITDDGLPHDARAVLRSHVGELVLAHPEGD